MDMRLDVLGVPSGLNNAENGRFRARGQVLFNVSSSIPARQQNATYNIQHKALLDQLIFQENLSAAISWSLYSQVWPSYLE